MIPVKIVNTDAVFYSKVPKLPAKDDLIRAYFNGELWYAKIEDMTYEFNEDGEFLWVVILVYSIIT